MSGSLIESLAQLNEKEVLKIVEDRIRKNEDPAGILKEIREGMDAVGQKYEGGDFYLGELVYAGEILKQVTSLIRPKLAQSSATKSAGTVVMGSVAGDLHDIGKNIVIFLLEANGFSVVDLGVDVPPATFVEKIKESSAGYVGLSGLLTAAIDSMKTTIKTIRKGAPAGVKVIIGGAPVDEEAKRYTGADAFGRDALDGVGIIKSWASA